MRRLTCMIPFTVAVVATITALAVSCNSEANPAAKNARPSFLISSNGVQSGGLRCILHTDSIAARVDSCSQVAMPTPPVTPPPAPAPAPAPAPVPPPVPPPTSTGCGGTGTFARTVNVSNAGALRTAMANAVPGDKIVIADGTYLSATAGEFRANRRAGTSSQRIALCGSVNAILNGGDPTNLTTTLSLVGAKYWTVSGFTITGGLFGIHADSADHLVLDHLTIHKIGQEAISLKQFSHHAVVQYNKIYDTGLKVAEYGEGVYVGTANSQWVGGVPDKTDSVVIAHNTFGPNVRAEAVDVKEATTGTRIIGNTFDGTGMVESQGSGESGWPNSPVILQGMNAHVDSNSVVHPLVAAFRVVTHGTTMTGSGNVFANKNVDAGGAKYGFLIQTGGAGNNVVKCNNTVTNAQVFSSQSCVQ
jgi:hypothetical protein